MQRAAGKQLFSDVSVWGSFGPMRRTRPVRGEPANGCPRIQMDIAMRSAPVYADEAYSREGKQRRYEPA